MKITNINVFHKIDEFIPTIELNIEIKFEEDENLESDKTPLSLACYRFQNDKTISLPSWVESRDGTSYRDYSTVTAVISDNITLLAGNIYAYTIEVYHGEVGKIASTTYTCPFFFEYSHLIDEERNLILKYNQDISNYKSNIMDIVTPTLGGAYPFIRRNGAQKYKTFGLNGLICLAAEKEEILSFNAEMKELVSLLTTSNFFKEDEKEYLKTYCDEFPSYNRSYDFRLYLERYYRERVLDFLQNGKVKLFKSMQEGDMFVYISNVSLTPDKVSGRALYSFSCTATEVCDPQEGYEKYLGGS